ncbi:hypothetical protein MicvaDRAFT_1104 [Microcoleus vaginatus FGP-2]|nr:hypothetical protein MicvaDRAFT_1104 [Microcoleus vaginatus FGP-2]
MLEEKEEGTLFNYDGGFILYNIWAKTEHLSNIELSRLERKGFSLFF